MTSSRAMYDAIQSYAAKADSDIDRPRIYTRPRELTPALRRYMTERGWIDRRTVTRIERPDPEHVARMYRLQELSPAEPAAVDVKV